jgi:hypothetical protein
MSVTLVGRFQRNPWVVISFMAHLAILAIVSLVVVTRERKEPPQTVTTLRVAPPQEVVPRIEPPLVIDRDLVPELRADTPDAISEVALPDAAEPRAFAEIELPSDGNTTGGTAAGMSGPGHVGIAPSATSGTQLGGTKFGPRSDPKRGGTRPTNLAVHEGLVWLQRHQDADGRWDADEFMKHDTAGEPCDGPGNPTEDVGVTGLALLAFLGDGSTMRTGPFKSAVRTGVEWLRDQQDPRTGFIGTPSHRDAMYGHAIATLALCEAYGLSRHPGLRKHAQRAIDYVIAARNPGAVWRYQPQGGDNDTSITGWMVLCLVSAREFGLSIDPAALVCAGAWLDQVTDPSTGRAGYTRRGELSSRRAEMQRRFPPEKSESMTAVGLLCRVFLGQDPATTPVMTTAAKTLLQRPPRWDTSAGTIDMYYWYYGSFALYQIGGKVWDAWNTEMTAAVLKSQRHDGNAKGSWDPVDAWGEDGGRVYSTAMMTLCLEVYYRYARVLGGR